MFPTSRFKTRPIELLFYYRNRLVSAEMAGKTSGMALPSEMIPERCARNAQPIPEELVTLCPEVVAVLLTGAKLEGMDNGAEIGARRI